MSQSEIPGVAPRGRGAVCVHGTLERKIGCISDVMRRSGDTLKIAIIGVGAIGGYVGSRLALAGEDVTFIARGANLEALRTRGIRLIMGRRQRAGRAARSRRPPTTPPRARRTW